MSTIVTRVTKGSALTWQEGDANIVNLNNDKIELNNLSVSTSGDGSLTYNNTTGAFTYTGPGVTQYRGAFSAGTNISITNGVISSTASGGIASVSADTTPSLGGNLNVSTFSLVSTSNGNIAITPNGTGRTVLKNIVYNESPVHSLGNISGTITPNAANGNVQTGTLTGNITFNAFVSPVAGQSITLILTQDSTGNRTLTSTMRAAGGVSGKTLSTAPSAVDIVNVFYDGSLYYLSIAKGFTA